MKAEITPTEKIKALKENLKPRVNTVKEDSGKLIVEADQLEFLEKVPGIEEYFIDEDRNKGLGGSPVDEKAYIKLIDREDVAKAFLATASGYDLVVVENKREWDLKLLRKFNPSIKEVSEPSDIFEINKSVNIDGYEGVKIDVDEEEVDIVYRQVFR